MKIFHVLPLAVLCSMPLSPAQEAVTDPVGVVNIDILSNSDTIVAVPLTSEKFSAGAVESIQGAGPVTVNVASNPNFEDDLSNFYYLRFTSGERNGMYYTITGNTATSLTLDNAGDDLSPVVAGDTFEIVKYWTLNSLFPYDQPETAANPLTRSLGNFAFQVRSRVLLPDTVGTGTNRAPQNGYFFTSNGWVKDISGNPPSNNVILPPDSYIIIRQPSTVTETSWSLKGNVTMGACSIPLATTTSGHEDNYVSVQRPVDQTISDLGLDTAFVESLGTFAFQRRDLLLLYSINGTGINRSASRTFYRTSSGWKEDIAGSPSADDVVVSAGSALVIRKYKTADGTTEIWENQPSY
jgi:uncharacterized protein (TIGR02597 family)